MTLLSPHALLWLALLPVLGALLLFRFHRRQGVLRRGAGPNARRFFAQTLTPVRAALKGLLLLLALLLLILALAEPAWGERTETIRREGRDVVFLLDLSRSMLADDLLPSRLERAKMEIAQCLETLEGDRIALVGFAGDARVFCPLTLDYGFFRMMLQEMTPDALSRGGTNLGDALRKVQRDVLDGQTALGRDVVLITDGEDQESMPVEAAKALGDAKIRLLAIGLGDDGEGTLLTLPDKRGGRAPLLYQGKPVRTRLDSQTLQAMADATPGGVYVPVGTRPFNLEEIYRQLVNTAERHQISEETVRRKNVHSTPFVLAAMVCLALFWLLPLGKRPRTPWLGLLLLLAALPLQGNDFHTGTQALQQQDYDTALAHFQKCREELSPEAIPATLPYNQGVAAYEKGDFPQAEAFFQEGMERNGLTPAPDRSLDGKLRLGLSSALLQNAAALFAQAQTPQPGDMTAQPLPAAEEKTREAINLLEDMLPENSLRKARETNLELARELLDNILAWKEQQQQQDSQRQDSQQQDSQQQDSQQQDSQQQDSQ
ncbi:MAG: VWA domain-containing protein, partial [Oligosphaeraceae bacterium]